MSNNNSSSEVSKFLDAVIGGDKDAAKRVELEKVVDVEPLAVVNNNPKPERSTFDISSDLAVLEGMQPLPAPKLNDRRGQLSEKISAFIDEYGVSVVPLEAVEIPDYIEELRDYNIVSMWGNLYAVNNTVTRRQKQVIDYATDLAHQYEDGDSVCELLKTTVRVGNTAYKTLKFNRHELNIINTLLQNYPFALISGNELDEAKLIIRDN